MDSHDSITRIEKASTQAYQQAMYLTVGIGVLLLAVSKICGIPSDYGNYQKIFDIWALYL